MIIKRLNVRNFQGLQSVGVDFEEGSQAVVGANGSGKTTLCRAILWVLTGTYAATSKFTNGKVRPLAAQKKDATVVEIEFETDAGTYSVKRSQSTSKPSIEFKHNDTASTGNEAEMAIMAALNVPSDMSLPDRKAFFTRIVWLGVGQSGSFFTASEAERRQILETLVPESKIGGWYDKTVEMRKAAEGELKKAQLEAAGSIANITLLRSMVEGFNGQTHCPDKVAKLDASKKELTANLFIAKSSVAARSEVTEIEKSLILEKATRKTVMDSSAIDSLSAELNRIKVANAIVDMSIQAADVSRASVKRLKETLLTNAKVATGLTDSLKRASLASDVNTKLGGGSNEDSTDLTTLIGTQGGADGLLSNYLAAKSSTDESPEITLEIDKKLKVITDLSALKIRAEIRLVQASKVVEGDKCDHCEQPLTTEHKVTVEAERAVVRESENKALATIATETNEAAKGVLSLKASLKLAAEANEQRLRFIADVDKSKFQAGLEGQVQLSLDAVKLTITEIETEIASQEVIANSTFSKVDTTDLESRLSAAKHGAKMAEESVMRITSLESSISNLTKKLVANDIASVEDLTSQISELDALKAQQEKGREADKLRSDLAAKETSSVEVTARISELETQVKDLLSLTDVLAPNGEAKTASLLADAAEVVDTANQFVTEMAINMDLGIALESEREQDGKPVIKISFRLNGSVAGSDVVTPSESQERVLSLAMDRALAKLARRDWPLIVDEPEQGLDLENRAKIVEWIKRQARQVIVITNNQNSTIERVIDVESAKKQLKGAQNEVN